METLLIAQTARVFVALVLFAAGVSKFMQMGRFRGALVSSGLLNAPVRALALVVVPLGELLLPIWLLISMDSRAAAAAVVVLLLVFTSYVFLLRVLKRDATCGCFTLAGKISDPMLGRNFGLMALVVAGTNQSLAPYFLLAGSVLFGYWAAAVLRRVPRGVRGT